MASQVVICWDIHPGIIEFLYLTLHTPSTIPYLPHAHTHTYTHPGRDPTGPITKAEISIFPLTITSEDSKQGHGK